MRVPKSVVLATVLGLWLHSAVQADEPKAILKGPTTAKAGIEFWMKAAGSVSDKATPLVIETAEGPEELSPGLLFTSDGTLGYAVVMAEKPGTYVFVAVASGVPPGASVVKRRYAFVRVVVVPSDEPPGPGPNPVPPTPVPPTPVPPGPTPPPPNPNPTPTPAPVPANVKIFGIVVFKAPDPRNPGSVEDIALANLIADPTLGPELKALNVEWRAMEAGDPRIAQWVLKPYIDRLGSLPALLVCDENKLVYDATGVAVDLSRAGAFKPILTKADLIHYFKQMRGK